VCNKPEDTVGNQRAAKETNLMAKTVDNKSIKQQVKSYWEANVCETREARSPKYSKGYFDEIEQYRYQVTPDIHEFAQFTLWHGKKVLEIGVGAGTDFVQWVRAGAEAYGIDLTEESINHTKLRLRQCRLTAKELRVADAEELPYDDNTFDLVYSWGTLHHTPNTPKAIGEAIRVAKKGGRIKLMLYNRHAAQMILVYLYQKFIKFRFTQSISRLLYYEYESIGTKAFTYVELKRIFAQYPVKIIRMKATPNISDKQYRQSWLARALAYLLLCVMGWDKAGFFMTIELEKCKAGSF
jgi:ubiquinone/menaquinone biosynthesis C-methylase UbiE